jgi:hypothetical protein
MLKAASWPPFFFIEDHAKTQDIKTNIACCPAELTDEAVLAVISRGPISVEFVDQCCFAILYSCRGSESSVEGAAYVLQPGVGDHQD